MKARIILLWIMSIVLTQSVQAQEPIALFDKSAVYKEAIHLYDHEKYSASMKKFEEFIGLESDPQNALRINAEYYKGICALYLLQPDAEYQLIRFVREHPDSPWKHHVYFELATFNYQRKSYKKALEWFQEVDQDMLSNDEKIAFFYKRGHSLFEEGDLKSARQDFLEVKQVESQYKQPAIYYYSHIAYEQKEYETALTGLSQIPILVPSFLTISLRFITSKRSTTSCWLTHQAYSSRQAKSRRSVFRK